MSYKSNYTTLLQILHKKMYILYRSSFSKTKTLSLLWKKEQK